MPPVVQPVSVKTIERFRFRQLHNQRALTIFLPSDYDRHATADRYYKVLYVNDGQDMPAVKMADTLATLIARQEIEPIIVRQAG